MARARKPKAKPTAGPTVFVVQARGNGVTECTFADHAAAEAHARALDRAARACASPFDFGHSKKISSVGVIRLRRALRERGIRPPKRGEAWYIWWEAVYPDTSAEQRDAVWDLLDLIHRYEVVEVPLED